MQYLTNSDKKIILMCKKNLFTDSDIFHILFDNSCNFVTVIRMSRIHSITWYYISTIVYNCLK